MFEVDYNGGADPSAISLTANNLLLDAASGRNDFTDLLIESTGQVTTQRHEDNENTRAIVMGIMGKAANGEALSDDDI